MNAYYALAILFTVAVMICGYLGQRHERARSAETSAAATQAIGTKLDALSAKIAQARDDGLPAGAVATLEESHRKIADEFYRDLPLQAQKHREKSAGDVVRQLRLSALLRPSLEALREELPKLVTAFNAHGSDIKLHLDPIPDNLFVSRDADFFFELRFPGGSRWWVSTGRFGKADIAVAFSVDRHPELPPETSKVKAITLTPNTSFGILLFEDSNTYGLLSLDRRADGLFEDLDSTSAVLADPRALGPPAKRTPGKEYRLDTLNAVLLELATVIVKDELVRTTAASVASP